MLLGEATRVEEVRRKAGDRGEVLSPVPCKEPIDVRLRNVGVIGRSLAPSEPELGALRRGFFLEWNGSGAFPWTSSVAMGGIIGDEGGEIVAVETFRA